jgi:hypothetical protein
MDKYSYKIKSPYPKLVEKLRRELRLDVVSAREENVLIKGSIYYQEFFDKNKGKLNLSNKADERHAIRTIKYFRDFVDEKYWQRSNEFEVYYLTNETINIQFVKYLKKHGRLK